MKKNNLPVGSYQHINTYIILPRYLFRNPFSNTSECISKRSMTYQRLLYTDVSCARWLGRTISVISTGAALARKPVQIRVTRYHRQLGQSELFAGATRGLPSSNEHPNWVGSCLENGGYNHDGCAYGNSSRSSAKPITEIRWNRICDKSPDILCFNELYQWSSTIYALNIPTWMAPSSPS